MYRPATLDPKMALLLPPSGISVSHAQEAGRARGVELERGEAGTRALFNGAETGGAKCPGREEARYQDWWPRTCACRCTGTEPPRRPAFHLAGPWECPPRNFSSSWM
mmetsp:Transcript_22178/g.68681  ORF Transcript_22178/g.68681 Transcript_22178/m.68681 type:complete len:107 (-) Transcript_22178:139-459(-)